MSHFCVYVFHDEYSSVDDILEPFSIHLECEPHIEYTKEEAINKCRKHIENYKNGTYKEYLANPTEYKEKYGHKEKHIEYLEKEFPKMLNWTDEECYEYEKKCYEEDDMIDKDGNLMSTYNPKAKWDWYEVGGRWSGTIDGNESTIEKIDADKVDIPFAFITPDGEWIERGKMRWWGIATNEMDIDEWDKKFREYIKTLDKKLIITQVDCHI